MRVLLNGILTLGLLALSAPAVAQPSPCNTLDSVQALTVTPADFGKCVMPEVRNGVVIESDSAFKRLFRQPSRYGCSDSSLPAIDFSIHTLVGAEFQTGGCSAGRRYRTCLTRNDSDKLYRFTITRKPNPCRGMGRVRFFALVPKLPNGYTVRFEVDNEEDDEK